jgi:3-deoxy-D-manno-octulosonic-acid transferase
VKDWGDLKFAAQTLPADPAALAALRALLPGEAGGPVWLAASTHESEEELVLAVHRALLADFPGLVTVIVPRHPARGDAVAAMAPMARRSRGETPAAGGIYLADTLGELGLFYRAAPFAFLGKSLAEDGGGHNVLEPARLGVPVIVGPRTANFTEAVRRLRDAGGLREVPDAGGLIAAVRAWLADPAATRAAGAAAQAATQGADDLPARLAALILAAMGEAL